MITSRESEHFFSPWLVVPVSYRTTSNVVLSHCISGRKVTGVAGTALMRHEHFIGTSAYAVTFVLVCVIGLTGCKLKHDGPDLTIYTSELPDGTVNKPYSTTVYGFGGETPYTWSVAPELPANLLFDAETGEITGTPVTEGTTSHTFTLTDSSSTTERTLTLTIKSPPGPLKITTTSLPEGYVGQAYSERVQATGGSGTRTWSLFSGTLPQDLSLNRTTGLISGTPTAQGTSLFAVRVTDTGGQEATQALLIVINPPSPPKITTTSLPGGTVGLPYSEVLEAIAGTGTFVWSLSSGSLPANLTLSPAGTISGTPTGTGTSNFTVRVTDALSQSDTQGLSISVSAALTITTSSLKKAKVGQRYDMALQRSGGVSPFTWSVTPALPTGLSLDPSTGKITGIPAEGTAGTYDRTFTVQDSSTPTKQTASKMFALTINP
jgi:hypothetical protein